MQYSSTYNTKIRVQQHPWISESAPRKWQKFRKIFILTYFLITIGTVDPSECET